MQQKFINSNVDDYIKNIASKKILQLKLNESVNEKTEIKGQFARTAFEDKNIRLLFLHHPIGHR